MCDPADESSLLNGGGSGRGSGRSSHGWFNFSVVVTVEIFTGECSGEEVALHRLGHRFLLPLVRPRSFQILFIQGGVVFAQLLKVGVVSGLNANIVEESLWRREYIRVIGIYKPVLSERFLLCSH